MSGDNTGSTPLLGVGLPVFNGELFIAQAIESILAQTFQDIRLFISDNCSSDGTAGICRTYAARDARVVYSRNPENIGLVDNAVRVLRETRPSKYFALIGHDDFWAPEFAETLIGLLEARPEATLAFCRHVYVDGAGRRLNLKGYAGISACGAARMGSPIRARRLGVAPPLCFEHAVLRADCFNPSLLDRQYGLYEDVFMVRALAAQGPALFEDQVLFYKRIHATNYSNDPAYQREHETINCTVATVELAKRYGFSWYEWLR